MRTDLMDAYSSAYCIFSQWNWENQCLGEVFAERPDWQPPQQARKAINRSRVITICSVLLVSGLTYLVR